MVASYDIDYDRVGLPGVQDKASLAMLSLPVRTANSSHILKLDPPAYPHLVENEAFFLGAAPRSRIPAAEAVVATDRDGVRGLVVTRFDREHSGESVLAFAVEDGCQVLGLHPEAKYRVSSEDVLGALVRVCPARGPAALELLRQAAFAFVTGNGDAHAKNFSVLADATGRYRPSPAYDLPTTQPYGDSTLALSVDGKRDGNLTGRRFIALGEAMGLAPRAARRAVVETATAVEQWIDELDELPFGTGEIRKLRRVILHRRDQLGLL